MKDIILQAFVAVITSAGISAAAVFILKTYLEHRIRFRFDQQLADFKSEHDKQLEGLKADYEKQLAFLKSQLDAQQAMQAKLLVGQFEARKELLGLVYACRDLARKIAENGDPDVFHDLRQRFEKAIAGFYDCLYNQRFLLHEPEFTPVHEFKRCLQIFSDLLKVQGSKERRQDVTSNLKEVSVRLDDEYSKVVSLFQKLSAPQEPLAMPKV